jgi:hypothetical protein
LVGVSKKTEKLIKPRKPEKNNRTEKKPIKILKKPTRSVRFYKQKTKKTEPKPKKTEPNRFEPVFALKKPNRKPVGLTWFWFGFGFFLNNNFGLVIFFDKNRTEPKIITPSY